MSPPTKSQQQQQQQPDTAIGLDDLRDGVLADDEDNDNETSQNNSAERGGQHRAPQPPSSSSSPQADREQQQRKQQPLPQQQQQQPRDSDEMPAVPVDGFFQEACVKAGLDPVSAFRRAPVPAPPAAPKSQQSAGAGAAARGESPRAGSRPSSATSSAGGDSVAAASKAHRAACEQERRLRDLLAVLQARKALMQEQSQAVARRLRFKQRLQARAAALRSNGVLAASWEKEMAARAALRRTSVKRARSNGGSSDGQQHTSDDDDHLEDYSVYAGDELGTLGRAGEDALFEHALRQRQVWDLRTMRQQRARDRRAAEFQVRLRRADERAAEEWRRHDQVGVEAKLICRANHARVKERRARDEAHIANVEARFAMIDDIRAAQHREHLAEIQTARQRRDEQLRGVVDQRRQHDEHMAEVEALRERQELERRAVIQDSIAQQEQQRTKHEFLRFVRDVELANRSLAERDRTLVVVHRSEELLQAKRERILEGFAKSEAAAERVERETREKAQEHAERREAKHFEARTLRKAQDEHKALLRIEKQRREEEALRRKAREEERRRAASGTRFEQKRAEQEGRVERLSRQLLVRRDQVEQTAAQRHEHVAQRRNLLNKILVTHSSSLVEM